MRLNFIFSHYYSEDVIESESDEVSVISESELCKTMSENETDKGEDDVKERRSRREITPPAIEDESCFIHNNKYFIFGAVFLIFAVFFLQISSLSNDLHKCDFRILRLEEENEMLKNALEQLEKTVKPVQNIETVNDLEFLEEEQVRTPPPTKTVWLGSETDHKVEILDKKYQLPDFCYKTEEDDLFFEYNQEICDQKLRKVDKAKTAKDSKRKNLRKNDKSEWNEKNYDDYIAEKLKEINNEILEIRRKKMERDLKSDRKLPENSEKIKEKSKFTEEKYNSKVRRENFKNSKKINENLQLPQKKPQFSPSKNFPEKPSKPRKKNQKRKDRSWIENKMNECEHENQDDKENVNWFLKRKNKR